LPGFTTEMNAKRNKLPLMIDVMTGFMVQYKKTFPIGFGKSFWVNIFILEAYFLPRNEHNAFLPVVDIKTLSKVPAR
jgi:hypothetical protein